MGVVLVSVELPLVEVFGKFLFCFVFSVFVGGWVGVGWGQGWGQGVCC